MPIAEVNGTRIGYEEHGSGAPLVLLPGLGFTHRMWERQVARFESTFRLITVEPRGVGDSGRLDAWRGLLRLQADDLAALLTDLGIERAVVCGVSFGGVLAQRFALDYPELVSGLVLCDTFSDTRPGSVGEALRLLALYAGGWAWLLPPRLLMPGIRRTYQQWPDVLRFMEQEIPKLRRLEVTKLRYALNGVAYTRELSRLSCPTLGLVGDSSAVLVDYMRHTVAAIPGARLERVRDSFDPSNLCRPEQFDRLLQAFLDEIGW